MGALAVQLPRRLGPLIGCAGEGRRGRDPSSQKGLGGAPEGERLPSNGAVARRVPGLTRRWKPGGRSAPTRGSGEGPPSRPPSAPGGGRKPPRTSRRENVVLAVGASSRPRPLCLTRGEAQRLILTRPLCRAPAAIVSMRGMEEPAICHRRVWGLWGILRKPETFLGCSRPSVSRKGPEMAFPKSDRRCEIVSPSLRPPSKP